MLHIGLGKRLHLRLVVSDLPQVEPDLEVCVRVLLLQSAMRDSNCEAQVTSYAVKALASRLCCGLEKGLMLKCGLSLPRFVGFSRFFKSAVICILRLGARRYSCISIVMVICVYLVLRDQGMCAALTACCELGREMVLHLQWYSEVMKETSGHGFYQGPFISVFGLLRPVPVGVHGLPVTHWLQYAAIITGLWFSRTVT